MSAPALPEKFRQGPGVIEFTNVFLMNPLDGTMLLGMKKRGFGEGKLNGFGGKLEDGETPLQCAHRELVEEACVRASELIKVGECFYRYEGEDDKPTRRCHVYTCFAWEGKPEETEEMTPKWFKLESLPHDRLWTDCATWFKHLIPESTTTTTTTKTISRATAEQTPTTTPTEPSRPILPSFNSTSLFSSSSSSSSSSLFRYCFFFAANKSDILETHFDTVLVDHNSRSIGESSTLDSTKIYVKTTESAENNDKVHEHISEQPRARESCAQSKDPWGGPFKEYTNVFIVDKSRKRILLGMKRRGFGMGLWNGFGGKIEAGESVLEAAERELLEEANVQAKLKLFKAGEIFYRHRGKEGDLTILTHVFTCNNITGEPQESEEMTPQWHDIDEIPFHSMWVDNKQWFPLITGYGTHTLAHDVSVDAIVRADSDIDHDVSVRAADCAPNVSVDASFRTDTHEESSAATYNHNDSRVGATSDIDHSHGGIVDTDQLGGRISGSGHARYPAGPKLNFRLAFLLASDGQSCEQVLMKD